MECSGKRGADYSSVPLDFHETTCFCSLRQHVRRSDGTCKRSQIACRRETNEWNFCKQWTALSRKRNRDPRHYEKNPTPDWAPGSLGRLQEGNRKNVLWPPLADGATSEVKDVTSSLLQDAADWDRRLAERDQHMMEQLTGLVKGVSETMEGRMSDLEKGCKISGWFSKRGGWKRSWNPTTKKLSSPRRSTGSSWRCKEKLTRDGGTVWTEKTDRITPNTIGIALRCGETQCETL